MKIFISWSGERSKLLAEGMRSWLPGVINAAEPWLSSSDIEPGSRWGPELARQLEVTKYGILCVTAENLNAPWLLFEAGALSKYVNESRVIPLLLDIKPTDVQGPLAQFQAARATENEINKLVTKINQAVFDAGEIGVNPSVIDNAFQLWWPQLKKCIDDIPEAVQDVKKSERSQKEIVEEILTLVRKIDKRVTQGRESAIGISSEEIFVEQVTINHEIEQKQYVKALLTSTLQTLEKKYESIQLDENKKEQIEIIRKDLKNTEVELEKLYLKKATLDADARDFTAIMKAKAKSLM